MLLISMHLQNLVKIHPAVLKILRRNEILTSIKGHNSILNLRKLTRNNPNLYHVNINAHVYAKLGQFHRFVLKILSRNEIRTSIKGHNSVMNWRKLMCNNPCLDFVNINAHANAKLGQNPSMCSQGI